MMLFFFLSILTFSHVSSKELSLCIGSCYSHDCPVITKDDLRQLTTKYLTPEVKKFILYIEITLDQISFSDLTTSHTGLDVSLIGSTHSDCTIDDLDFGSDLAINSHIVNLTLNELTFSSNLYLNIKNVTLINCENSADTTISFYENVNVTANELYLATLARSLQGTISNFTFLMDYYDTVTLYDDEYHFEDKKANSDVLIAKYSLMKSFHIVYDVSTHLQYQIVDFNVTAATSKTPDLTVTFQLYEYEYKKRGQFILSNWSKTANPGKIEFYHGELPVNVVLTEPYLPKTFSIYGSGELTYITDYTDKLTICAYHSSASNCPSGSTQVMFENINDYIPNVPQDNIEVYVVGSDETFHLTIGLGAIDKKKVHFIGDKSRNEYVDITNYQLVSDPFYSSTNFSYLHVGTVGGPISLAFGELQFNDCQISGFENVNLTVDDFFTTYEILYKFKNVHILDNLVVSGPLVDSEKTITFSADENSEDLRATLIADTTITMGEGYVLIGKTRFEILKSPKFDIILNIPNPNTKIDLKCDYQADSPNIPYVRFPNADSIILNFIGQWPGMTIKQRYLVSIYQANNVIINLESENIPFECESISNNFELVALSEKVGITGKIGFSLNCNSKPTFRYDETKVSKASISFSGGIYIGTNIWFELLQPNLELSINNIHRNATTEIPIVSFVFYIGDKGSSSAYVNQLDNTKFNSSWSVLMQFTGNLDDSRVQSFINTDTAILKSSDPVFDDIELTSFSFHSQSSTIHGINSNTFKLFKTSNENSVVIRNIIDPFSIPFELCYGSQSSCEITLTDQTFSSFSNLLPASSKLVLRFVFSLSPNSNVLNFDVDRFSGIDVTIEGSYVLNCEFGQNKLSNLHVSKMNLTTTKAFSIDSVTITEYGAFLSTDKMAGISHLTMDFASFSRDLLRSFANDLTLLLNNDNNYVITFLNNGFTIEANNIYQSTLKSQDFPYLTLILNGTQVPKFTAEYGATVVNKINIISNSAKFIIGENWGTIVGPEINLTLAQDLKNIKVEAFSYPFKPFSKTLMSVNSVQFSQTILPYTVETPLKLKNENYQISFADVSDQSKEKVYIKELYFEGQSTLGFKDYKSSKMPGQIKNCIVYDNSVSSVISGEITDLLEIEKSAIFNVDQNFEVEDSVVRFVWDLNKIPQLKYSSMTNSFPKGVEISFDKPTIFGLEDDYNSFLYQNSFTLVSNIPETVCKKWISNLTFLSQVRYFETGSELVLGVECHNGNLQLSGKSKISASDENDSKTGLIIGLTLGLTAFLILSVLIIVIGIRKKRGIKLLNDKPLNSIKDPLNPTNYENEIEL